MSSTFDLLFRTNDAARWGDGKGAPLSAQEVDMNFWRLLELYLALEANPASPKEITSITVSNNAMTVTLSDSSTFGPFALPVAAFRWRGNWQAATAYTKFDIFTASSGLYMALNDFTSDSVFDPNASDLAGAEYELLLAFPVSFDIGFFFPGLPGTGITDGKPIFAYRFARDAYLKASLPETVGGLGIATTADLAFTIKKNSTTIGTVNIAAAASAATFTFASDVQFAANDILSVLKPASIDATAADLTVTFAAVKGLIETPSV